MSSPRLVSLQNSPPDSKQYSRLFLMAVAGLRLIIGVGSPALSSEATAFADGLHASWLRIPMISLAFSGAAINLIAILQIRRLRARPSSQCARGLLQRAN